MSEAKNALSSKDTRFVKLNDKSDCYFYFCLNLKKNLACYMGYSHVLLFSGDLQIIEIFAFSFLSFLSFLPPPPLPSFLPSLARNLSLPDGHNTSCTFLLSLC